MKFVLCFYLLGREDWQGLRAVHARRARQFQFIVRTTKGPIDVFYVGEKNFRATKLVSVCCYLALLLGGLGWIVIAVRGILRLRVL
jgi:hypothetical protein